MGSKFAALGNVAVVGFGQSTIERKSARPLGALALQAADDAIVDAGLRRDQIDGLSCYPLLPARGDHGNIDGVDIVTVDYIAEHLGIRPRWFNNFQGIGQIGASMIHAANAIAAGAADYVVVHRALHNPGGRYHSFRSPKAYGREQWTAPYGQVGAPATMALTYMEYMARYGATREEMATLVLQIRQNVQRIPEAYWYGVPLTHEDYMQARVVADPMSILDCDIPVDGAAAWVLTNAERAKDLKHKPVYISGYTQSHPFRPRPFVTLDQMMESGLYFGRQLWERSGLSPKDVDVPQIYDGFSPLTLLWLEALGFCPVGEAHSFIQNGAIDVDGPFPLLSGGGNLGNGRVHGIPHIRECYLQLSGRAGDRQLKKATVGLCSHSFPDWGSALLYTTEPVR